jgi:hypothetical protein
MKPRARPLRNLWFRWGQHYGLNDSTVAKALESHGLISVEGDFYAETQKMKDLESIDLEVHKILKTLSKG